MVNCVVQDLRKVRLDTKHRCLPFVTSDCICELCLTTLGRCPIQEDEATMHIRGSTETVSRRHMTYINLWACKFVEIQPKYEVNAVNKSTDLICMLNVVMWQTIKSQISHKIYRGDKLVGNTPQDHKNCPDEWFRKEDQPQIGAGVLEARKGVHHGLHRENALAWFK